MGQRADGYLHAFDGMFLNWDAVFGAGWRDVPKNWVSVFRGCSVEELLKVAREGISAPSPDMRPGEVRAELELVDSFRPLAVTRRGISRLGSIDASPTPEIRRQRGQRLEAVLEFKVDPEECMVGDLDLVAGIAPFIDGRRRRAERFGGAFRAYWDSLIPFRDFLKHYSRIETMDGTHWVREARAPKDLPESFFLPEVLVLSSRVSARHIRMIRPRAVSSEYEEWDE